MANTFIIPTTTNGAAYLHLNTINEIAKRMQAAGKTKEAQDLQNAMQTQIALLNADKIKMDIARNSEELADRKAEKQQELLRMKRRHLKNLNLD
ncbi:type IV secretion system protein [Aggregatibacter actinomycetemcomitans]|uniref:type IV secretion system protein n=1 Tax=Aggregatibacter actinomycetemcomitans TaxID=714 RepID=UPI000519991A|nr:type IV secretion system protein [Aggregatibacter actinomycetemcomitans]